MIKCISTFLLLVISISLFGQTDSIPPTEDFSNKKIMRKHQLSDTMVYTLGSEVYTGENINNMVKIGRALSITGAILMPAGAVIATGGILLLIDNVNHPWRDSYDAVEIIGAIAAVNGGLGFLSSIPILAIGIGMEAKWLNIKRRIVLNPIIAPGAVGACITF